MRAIRPLCSHVIDYKFNRDPASRDGRANCTSRIKIVQGFYPNRDKVRIRESWVYLQLRYPPHRQPVLLRGHFEPRHVPRSFQHSLGIIRGHLRRTHMLRPVYLQDASDLRQSHKRLLRPRRCSRSNFASHDSCLLRKEPGPFAALVRRHEAGQRIEHRFMRAKPAFAIAGIEVVGPCTLLRMLNI